MRLLERFRSSLSGLEDRGMSMLVRVPSTDASSTGAVGTPVMERPWAGVALLGVLGLGLLGTAIARETVHARVLESPELREMLRGGNISGALTYANVEGNRRTGDALAEKIIADAIERGDSRRASTVMMIQFRDIGMRVASEKLGGSPDLAEDVVQEVFASRALPKLAEKLPAGEKSVRQILLDEIRNEASKVAKQEMRVRRAPKRRGEGRGGEPAEITAMPTETAIPAEEEVPASGPGVEETVERARVIRRVREVAPTEALELAAMSEMLEKRLADPETHAKLLGEREALEKEISSAFELTTGRKLTGPELSGLVSGVRAKLAEAVREVPAPIPVAIAPGEIEKHREYMLELEGLHEQFRTATRAGRDDLALDILGKIRRVQKLSPAGRAALRGRSEYAKQLQAEVERQRGTERAEKIAEWREMLGKGLGRFAPAKMIERLGGEVPKREVLPVELPGARGLRSKISSAERAAAAASAELDRARKSIQRFESLHKRQPLKEPLAPTPIEKRRASREKSFWDDLYVAERKVREANEALEGYRRALESLK